jgi:hypothetical protein
LGTRHFRKIAGRIALINECLDENPTSSKASEITRTNIVYATHDHTEH